MTDELTQALLLEEAVSPSAIADALFASVTGGVPLVQALIDAGAATPEVLGRYLARSDAPFVRQVIPVPELVDRLPTGICARLFAVPIRRDAITGTVDVAVADASDPHAAEELAFHLDAPVRVIRAPIAAIDEAVRRVRMQSLPPPASSRRLSRPPAPPFSEDEPVYDSRPRGPSARRRDTLPPGGAPRGAISVPPALPPLVPPAARRNTPPWGTPVHARAKPSESDTPKSGLGSEIPIPLTRKTFTVERGGTQRPPPLLHGSDAQLGEGIPVDVASFRTIVEVRGGAPDHHERVPDSRPLFIPAAPPVPASGPFAAYAPHPNPVQLDASGILASLRTAETRDEVLELLLTGARALAARVALFVVKRGGYLGWACTPELGDRRALQEVLIPLESQSVFDLAVQEGLYLGPIRNDDVHAGLLSVMKGASRDVAVAPVRVMGKTAVVVLADELGDTMTGTRRLEEIARAAGEAFARIVRNRPR